MIQHVECELAYLFSFQKGFFFSFVLFAKLKEHERNGLLYYKYTHYLFHTKVFTRRVA